jgi:hypothetical protein
MVSPFIFNTSCKEVSIGGKALQNKASRERKAKLSCAQEI